MSVIAARKAHLRSRLAMCPATGYVWELFASLLLHHHQQRYFCTAERTNAGSSRGSQSKASTAIAKEPENGKGSYYPGTGCSSLTSSVCSHLSRAQKVVRNLWLRMSKIAEPDYVGHRHLIASQRQTVILTPRRSWWIVSMVAARTQSPSDHHPQVNNRLTLAGLYQT